MTKLLIILLSISLSSIAHADNSVFIEQITTSDDTTITVNQDGNNNAVNLTMAHDDNTLDLQLGNNNYIGWTDSWGSGYSWGGDLDGTNNNIKIEQNNTTGSDSNRIGFHIQSNAILFMCVRVQLLTSSSDTTCSGTANSEYGGHTTNLDLHSGGNNIKIGQETGTGNADHYVQLYTYGGENNDTFIKQKEMVIRP